MANSKNISIKLLGKEYQVSCPIGQEHKLIDSALMLDEKMQEIRKSGRVIGVERIAIMAALNLANLLLDSRSAEANDKIDLEKKINSLTNKMDQALTVTPAS